MSDSKARVCVTDDKFEFLGGGGPYPVLKSEITSEWSVIHKVLHISQKVWVTAPDLHQFILVCGKWLKKDFWKTSP